MFCHRCFPIRCLVPWHARARARAPAGPGGRVRRSCRTSVPIAASTTSASVSDAACVPRRAIAGCPWRDGKLFSRTGLRSVRENNYHRNFDRFALCRCSRGAVRVSSRTRWRGSNEQRQCLLRIIFQPGNARSCGASTACICKELLRLLHMSWYTCVRAHECNFAGARTWLAAHVRRVFGHAASPGTLAKCTGRSAWLQLAQTQADRLATIGSP